MGGKEKEIKTIDSLDDEYTETKALQTSEGLEATITNTYDLPHSRFIVELSILDEKRYLRFLQTGSSNNTKHTDFQTFLLDLQQYTDQHTLTELTDITFPIDLSQDGTSCTFNQNTYEIITGRDSLNEKRLTESELDVEEAIKIANTIETYKQEATEYNALECRIDSVTPADDNSFEIHITPNPMGTTLTWELSVPDVTDPNKNPTTSLIETVGQGKIQFLEDETVYIIPRMRTENTITTCGYDTTGEWQLITPREYKNFVDKKQEQKEKRKNNTNTSSGSELDIPFSGWNMIAASFSLMFVWSVVGLPMFRMMETVAPPGSGGFSQVLSAMELIVPGLAMMMFFLGSFALIKS